MYPRPRLPEDDSEEAWLELSEDSFVHISYRGVNGRVVRGNNAWARSHPCTFAEFVSKLDRLGYIVNGKVQEYLFDVQSEI